MPASATKPSICVVSRSDLNLDSQTLRDFRVVRQADDAALPTDVDLVLWAPEIDSLRETLLEECVLALRSHSMVMWRDSENLEKSKPLGGIRGPIAMRSAVLSRSIDSRDVHRLPWSYRPGQPRNIGDEAADEFGLPRTLTGSARVKRKLDDSGVLKWRSWQRHPVDTALRLVPRGVKERVNRLAGLEVFDLSFYRRFDDHAVSQLHLSRPSALYEPPPKSRPRVAVLCPNLGVGGAESVLLSMVSQLDRERCEIFVLATESLDSRLAEEWHRVADYVYDLRPLVGPGENEGTILFMASSWQFDVVIVQNSLSAYRAALAVKWVLPEVKIVDVLHNVHAEHDLHELGRDVARTFDRRVVISELGRQKLLRSGCPTDAVHLIRTGVDLERFRRGRYVPGAWKLRHGISEHEHVLVFAGHLISRKHPEVLVEVDQELSRRGVSDYRFVLVGDGPERDTLCELISVFGADDRFTLLGHVDDVAEVLADADLLLLPSEEEGTPLVITEALAMGVPAISTRVGAVDEILPSECGAIVDYDEKLAGSMADAVAALLNDPLRRQAMASAGRDFAARQHDSRAIEASYRDLFDRLLFETGDLRQAEPSAAHASSRESPQHAHGS